VLATLFEVVVLERYPAEQDVPTVLFPAQDAETRPGWRPLARVWGAAECARPEGTVLPTRPRKAACAQRRQAAAEPGFARREQQPSSRELGAAPAAEDQAADREAEAEGAERERAERDRLAHPCQALPAPERLLFLGRQRLSAPLLAQRAPGSESEVEVVEDLSRLVDHDLSV
jgi:hypothetical protein